MKILALEFSANERSVAVAASAPHSQANVLGLVKESSREVTGLALIDRALVIAQVNPGDITHIIVGLGPGSYTGIRSSIALAQGWQLGRNVQTHGLSSVQCLAAQAHTSGMRGEFSIIVDAQRGDIYHQKFNFADNFSSATELKIAPRQSLNGASNVIGPDASKLVPGALDLSPSAEFLVRFMHLASAHPAELLEPIYLREASFVKAPPPRSII